MAANGEGVGATEKRHYGLPPLCKLRAIMDVRGITREQLASRSGLSQPTITRVIEGRERVRRSTAERVARAVGAPTAALYDDLAFAELSGRLKLPPVVAGRGYGYPQGSGESGKPEAGEDFEGGFAGESPSRSSPNEGSARAERQYVIVHRREWRALHETLSTISGRLTSIEEAVGELATRPIAEFDVQVNLEERGKA